MNEIALSVNMLHNIIVLGLLVNHVLCDVRETTSLIRLLWFHRVDTPPHTHARTDTEWYVVLVMRRLS